MAQWGYEFDEQKTIENGLLYVTEDTIQDIAAHVSSL
jgi:hypothetical protein